MEQIGLALILFAAFWVGCAAGYIAMRLRAQVAYEKGRNESAAEISALTERLNGRDLQCNEARQRADTGAETIARMETDLRAETDRRTVAEARLTLLPKYEAEVEARGKKLAEQQAELTKLHVSASELSTRLEEAKRTSEDKINTIQALQSRVTESFQTMSAEALMSNNKAFLDLAGDALTRLQESARGDLDQRQSLFGQIMEPLKSSLDRVDSRISELERDRANAYAGLQRQVESMMRSQVSLQAETSHLASALRTPSSRGRWGEVQLRRVVELAGMISHCDFIEPRSTEEGGASGRPDLIVQLPNFRQIVVDSKVSLAAYLESNDASDEAARLEKRRAHAAQVRAHVTQLSAKGYWDQFPQSPEFVVAFLPGESFFSAALELDPELLEFGVERRVILATPTTLIALLRAVAWGWKQEMVSSNAREIRDLGKALYDRLRSLADNFTEVQRGLSRTTAAFNRTVGAFESNVIPAARRMRELGASTGDEIVSPPPVDSTPRSLQLLAEATEPAPAAGADTFDGAQAPLAKIPVTAAGAQPRGVSTRQTVEPAAVKTSPPVPVNRTALDAQRSNGSGAPARSAEPQRLAPNAASRPAAAESLKPLLRSVPVPPAEASSAAKPAGETAPVVESVKPLARIATPAASEPVTAVKPSAAKPEEVKVTPPASESGAPQTPVQPTAAEPAVAAKPAIVTAAPSSSESSDTCAPIPPSIAAKPAAGEPTPPKATTQVPIEPVTVAKPATASVATHATAPAVPSAPAPSAAEPVATPKPNPAPVTPPVSQPAAPIASVLSAAEPFKLAATAAVPQASELAIPSAPAEPAATAKPNLAPVTPPVSQPAATAGLDIAPTPPPSEPPLPITFVLATLPAMTEQPIAPLPVLPEIEPVSQAPVESLKALAALYSAKPNGKPESAAPERHAQAAEMPVATVS